MLLLIHVFWLTWCWQIQVGPTNKMPRSTASHINYIWLTLELYITRADCANYERHNCQWRSYNRPLIDVSISILSTTVSIGIPVRCAVLDFLWSFYRHQTNAAYHLCSWFAVHKICCLYYRLLVRRRAVCKRIQSSGWKRLPDSNPSYDEVQ